MNKVFIALLVGIAVGILIAPAKGSESMSKLGGRLNGLVNKFKSKKSRTMYQQALDSIGEHIGAI